MLFQLFVVVSVISPIDEVGYEIMIIHLYELILITYLKDLGSRI